LSIFDEDIVSTAYIVILIEHRQIYILNMFLPGFLLSGIGAFAYPEQDLLKPDGRDNSRDKQLYDEIPGDYIGVGLPPLQILLQMSVPI
jgi:hypothetical protein